MKKMNSETKRIVDLLVEQVNDTIWAATQMGIYVPFGHVSKGVADLLGNDPKKVSAVEAACNRLCCEKSVPGPGFGTDAMEVERLLDSMA